MAYFKYFPKTFYSFGDGEDESLVQNLSVYTEVLDDVKESASYYQDYTIQENERPDQVSMKLYGDPKLHWTLYLMNDKLREQGWPLCNEHAIAKSMKDHPGVTLTTREALFDKFKVGQVVKGNTSEDTGTIVYRNLDLGQLILEDTTGNFVDDTLITSDVSGVTESIAIVSSSREYQSAHHYDSDGTQVDIDPFTGPGQLLNEVTHIEYDLQENDSLKQIRVLRPDSVVQVAAAFRKAMGS